MARFELDFSEVERLMQTIKDYEGDAESIINEVFKEIGTEEVKSQIQPLIPVSGRTWKGKKAAAKRAKPFVEEFDNLSFVVKTKYEYHYLYFPDDGSNTRKHAGNKQFMQRGAEKAAPKIIEQCLARLGKE